MRYTAPFCVALLLSACSGGGQGVAPPGGPSAGNARFSIAVPAQSTAAQRGSNYVSAATRSIAIAVNGGAGVVTALSGDSPACMPSQTNAVRTAGAAFGLTCTVNVTAPVGNDTFAVSIFASSDGSGTALATQSIAATVTQGQTTPVNLTLDGAIASLSLLISDAAPVEGSAQNITLTVVAKDAAGATIVGPGNFTQPVTITDSDTSGATALSAGTVAGPDPGTVTVTYTGAHVSATFSASAPGASDAARATLTSHARPSMLWVANNYGGTVTGYDATGNVAPVTTITGLSSDPLCQAFDAQGNLWIVTSPGSKQSGEIDEVPAAAVASGSVTATSGVIRGSSTQIDAVGCAFDKNGNFWLANVDNYQDSLIAFSPSQLTGGGGDVSPAIVINPTNNCCGGSNGSLCNTVGVTFDASGNLWVANLCTNAVEYAASSLTSSGAVVPIAWFAQAFGPSAMAFDPSGNLWTTGNNSVTMFTAASLAGARNNVAASVTISGLDTQLNGPFGIAFDAAGNMAVADQGSNAITIYSASSLSEGGDIVPSAVISGSNTGLSGPAGIIYH